MLAVYLMRHLKSVCSEDRIYALPSSTSGFLEDLTSVTKQAALTQAPQFGPQAVSGTSFVDENMEANVPLEQPASSPVICFRLVHLQPKRQQSVNLLSSLRGDHVAVRLYDVQDVHPETKSISLSSQMELKPKADDVKLLSLSSFLSMGSETVAKTMAECEVNSEISYFFSSQSLSTLAHGKMGRSLVTKMVNAQTQSLPRHPHTQRSRGSRVASRGRHERLRCTYDVHPSGHQSLHPCADDVSHGHAPATSNQVD